MRRQLHITSITRNAGTGAVTINYNGKYGREFASREAFVEWCRDILTDERIILVMGLATVMDGSPTLAKLRAMEGKTITLDTAAANLIEVT